MPLEKRAMSEKLRPYSGTFSDDSPLPPVSPLEEKMCGKEFDPVTFSVLMVSAEDFASQLTLLDLPVFAAIQPEELTSCAWNTSAKLQKCPNIVAFTHRFNQVCLWCQREILNAPSLKSRTETLAHFIKIAKKLFELQNLHSSFAILSGLQSQAIYRLSKTWAGITSKEKGTFEKLTKIFQRGSNWERLRELEKLIKLPCIPYLGIYLTDLTYIDVAHPTSGVLCSGQRDLQMNNILRILADMQQSNYDHLPRIECVKNYLKSVRYIDELQKFVEEDNYKLSLQLEPDVPSLPKGKEEPDSGRRCSTTATAKPIPAILAKEKALSLTPQIAHAKPLRGHRKTQSLGNPLQFRYLLDDSLMESSYFSSHTPGSSTNSSKQPLDAAPVHPVFMLKEDSGNGSAEDSDAEPNSAGVRAAVKSPESRRPDLAPVENGGWTIEGPIRRKTILKEGRRPAVQSWTRYWLRLWDTNLLYYPTRSLPPLKGAESRAAFRKNPSKSTSLQGWMVLLGDDPFHPDTFQLQEPSRGNVYKFRSASQAAAMEWYKELKKAIEKFEAKPPDNLMSFE